MADSHGTGAEDLQDCSCCMCGKKNNVMKRCTRCRNVYYCSRECQIKAWPAHRKACGSLLEPETAPDNHTATSVGTSKADSLSSDRGTASHTVVRGSKDPRNSGSAVPARSRERSIFEDGEKEEEDTENLACFDHCAPVRKRGVIKLHSTQMPPQEESARRWKPYSEDNDYAPSAGKSRTDLSAAIRNVKRTLLSHENNSAVKSPQGKKYMMNNVFHYDVPTLSDTEERCDISVRANKDKMAVTIQKSWTGDEVFRVLSCESRIPLEKMKVIHKGKVLTRETVTERIQPRAVFQLIGEQALCEDGLETMDIEVMMQQLGIERNQAVAALRKNGDLLDALIASASKQ